MSTSTRNITHINADGAEIRRQIDAWLRQYENDITHFVTLTFDPKHIDAYINSTKKNLDRHSPELVMMYQRSMKHFLNRLQKECYGNLSKRSRSPLLFIPVIEGLTKDEVPHYHCFMRVDSDRENIQQVIAACWERVQFAGRQIDVQNYRDRGCLTYGTKNALSLHRESVDWLNVQMPKSINQSC